MGIPYILGWRYSFKMDLHVCVFSLGPLVVSLTCDLPSSEFLGLEFWHHISSVNSDPHANVWSKLQQVKNYWPGGKMSLVPWSPPGFGLCRDLLVWCRPRAHSLSRYRCWSPCYQPWWLYLSLILLPETSGCHDIGLLTNHCLWEFFVHFLHLGILLTFRFRHIFRRQTNIFSQ